MVIACCDAIVVVASSDAGIACGRLLLAFGLFLFVQVQLLVASRLGLANCRSCIVVDHGSNFARVHG